MKLLVIALLSTLAVGLATSLQAGEKQLVGWVEKVRLYPEGVMLDAKLDTGALHCSLDAENLTYFKRQGAEWVRFDVVTKTGRKYTLERPLVGQATIKRHFNQSQKRPVVRLGVCVGEYYQETDVNLVDRSGFQFPMLIGRVFMKGALVIDPAAKHTMEPHCKEPRQVE
jgi:hypothetical protein